MIEIYCSKIKSLFAKAKKSFFLASKGKEDLKIVLWAWGIGAYVTSFFVNKLIIFTGIPLMQWIISIIAIAYFIWHIVALKKCSPKKTPLTNAEKEQYKKDRLKRISNKLLLREPISKWNPAYAQIAFNLYLIVCFSEYLL
ncbi:MAG: fatty acid desaturase [Myxococcota bacterium]|jgi:fatty acid desaturase